MDHVRPDDHEPAPGDQATDATGPPPPFVADESDDPLPEDATIDGPEPPAEEFRPARARPPASPMSTGRLVLTVLGAILFFSPIFVTPLFLMAGARRQTSARWTAFSPQVPAGERWSAEFPGPPSVSAPPREDGLLVTQVMLATPTGSYYVASATFPEGALDGARQERLLDYWDSLFGQGAPEGKRRVLARSDDVVDGRPARRSDLELVPLPEQRTHARQWLVMAGRSAFAIIVQRLPGDLDSPDAVRFLRSVKLPR